MKSRSQRAQERRERRNKVLISLLLVFLMVFSTIGFFFSEAMAASTRSSGTRKRSAEDASEIRSSDVRDGTGSTRAVRKRRLAQPAL